MASGRFTRDDNPDLVDALRDALAAFVNHTASRTLADGDSPEDDSLWLKVRSGDLWRAAALLQPDAVDRLLTLGDDARPSVEFLDELRALSRLAHGR